MGLVENLKGIVKNFLDLNVSGTGVPPPRPFDKKERVSSLVRTRLRNLHKPSFNSAMQIENLINAIAEAKKPPYYSLYRLYQVYEFIAEDADVYSEFQTRKLKTLAEDFCLVEKNGNENEELEQLLNQEWFSDFINYALDAILWHHSLIEFDELDADGYVKGVTLIERQFVNPRQKTILAFPSNANFGYSYEDNEHLIEIHSPDNDLGLLRIVGKHAIWKQYSYTDWSRLSEKYGIPLLLLFLDSSDENEIESIMKEMQQIGSNGVASLNVTDKAEFLQMQNSDPYKIFQESHNMHSNIISKVITGQSDATNSNSSGSYARAETHLSILNDRVRADLRCIQYIVNNKLIPFLIKQSPKYKGLANYKFVYQSLKDEKLLKNNTIQSTLNSTQTKTQTTAEKVQKEDQSFDFFA